MLSSLPHPLSQAPAQTRLVLMVMRCFVVGSQPGYNPNTSHCIHGMDADLIMLALSTHEPYFYILRDYVGPACLKPTSSQQESTTPASPHEGDPRVRVQESRSRNLLLVTCLTAHDTSGDQVERTMAARGVVQVPGLVQPATEKQDAEPVAPFQFLQIPVLRDYLETEFSTANFSAAPHGFDLERVIDDFVFLCFFVGNDFLPHMASLNIRDGAIDSLCDLYRRSFSVLGGWITEGGSVDLERVKMFCSELGRVEESWLISNRKKEAKLKARRNRQEADKSTRPCERKHTELLQKMSLLVADHTATPDSRLAQEKLVLGKYVEVFQLFQTVKHFSLLPDYAPPQTLSPNLTPYERAMVCGYCDELGVAHVTKGKEPNRSIVLEKRGMYEILADSFKRELGERCASRGEVPEQEDLIRLGEPGWRDRYYDVKFAEFGLPSAVCADVAHAYAEGLCWVMRYYYDGCASWRWYYPFHYAPFAVDVARAISPGAHSIEFELGRPFQPLEQLMAVLPPRSAHALPPLLSQLMLDKTTPIADFYPRDFEVDLNGKVFLWQAVIKLPFIDEGRLLDAMAPWMQWISADEQRLNCFGVSHLFVSETHTLFEHVQVLYEQPLGVVEFVVPDGVDDGGEVTVEHEGVQVARPHTFMRHPPHVADSKATRSLAGGKVSY